MERLFAYPNVVRPRGMLIYGQSGMGKSALTWKFQSMHPPVERNDKELTFRPVVSIVCPARPEPRLILSRILKIFDPLAFDKGSADHMYHRVIGYFKECQVKMLQIDDIDGLVDTGTQRQLKATMAEIRKLSDSTGVSIIMTGIPTCERMLSPDPRLASRFRTFELPEVKDGDDYKKFLYAKESTIPLPRPSNLWSKEKRLFLLNNCNRIRGDIIDTVNEAAVQAILDGSDSVTLQRLEQNLVSTHKRKHAKNSGLAS
jgi:hypothetical protein